MSRNDIIDEVKILLANWANGLSPESGTGNIFKMYWHWEPFEFEASFKISENFHLDVSHDEYLLASLHDRWKYPGEVQTVVTRAVWTGTVGEIMEAIYQWDSARVIGAPRDEWSSLARSSTGFQQPAHLRQEPKRNDTGNVGKDNPATGNIFQFPNPKLP